MTKKFFLLLVAVSAAILFLFSTYSFSMTHRPTPVTSDAEEMIRAYDLEKFGTVESSYMATPDNFGFYNKHRLYVVERGLGDQEENLGQYAAIAKGGELTAEEEKLAEQYEKYQKAAHSSLEDVQVLSKHEVTIYHNQKEVRQEFVFKVIAVYKDEKHLSFSNLQPETEGPAFNLFAEGAEQFADF